MFNIIKYKSDSYENRSDVLRSNVARYWIISEDNNLSVISGHFVEFWALFNAISGLGIRE